MKPWRTLAQVRPSRVAKILFLHRKRYPSHRILQKTTASQIKTKNGVEQSVMNILWLRHHLHSSRGPSTVRSTERQDGLESTKMAGTLKVSCDQQRTSRSTVILAVHHQRVPQHPVLKSFTSNVTRNASLKREPPIHTRCFLFGGATHHDYHRG